LFTLILCLLAEHNHGFATFVGNDEIYEAVTSFFITVCTPTLNEPVFSVLEPGDVYEIYPVTISNLYLGRQNLICGKYSIPREVLFILNGQIFGHPVTYQYQINLSGINQPEYYFLPQLWAKKKIEHLLEEYYTYSPNQPEALALRQQITQISSDYSVLTIFDENGMLDNPEDGIPAPDADIILLGSFPNPFSRHTIISFNTYKTAYVKVNVYNIKGQLVCALLNENVEKGEHEAVWNGRDN
jgi:hypothetical protein